MGTRARTRGPITLCVDIGGSGVKAMRVSARGVPMSDRTRVPTPRPATPQAVLAALDELVRDAGPFDRVSAGFPGVVEGGVVRTAPNLHRSWAGTDLRAELERRACRPARVLNDAGIQGFGAVEGRGVEACITLGTGMGFSLFVDGTYVPNIELGHHPLRGKRTYEELVNAAALEEVGKVRWRRRVGRVLAQIRETFNPRAIFVGGGNAKKLDPRDLPQGVSIVPNVAGLLGGVRLWEPLASAARPARRSPRRRPRGDGKPETRAARRAR
jgi:polyphosphate glucokinase